MSLEWLPLLSTRRLASTTSVGAFHPDLVAALGKREHKVSFGTKDPATAKIWSAQKCIEFDRLEKLARALSRFR